MHIDRYLLGMPISSNQKHLQQKQKQKRTVQQPGNAESEC